MTGIKAPAGGQWFRKKRWIRGGFSTLVPACRRKPEPRLAVQLRLADQCGKAGRSIEIEMA
jgi:hypothetical protein